MSLGLVGLAFCFRLGRSCLAFLLRLSSRQPLSLGLVRLAFFFCLGRSCLAFLLGLNNCQPLLLSLVRLAIGFRLGTLRFFLLRLSSVCWTRLLYSSWRRNA